MKHEPTTSKQKEIINLLNSFRFLNTNQIQKLMHHKLPTRIQAWLKDLKDKGYIGTHYSRQTAENSQPAIYYLMPEARHVLEKGTNFDAKLFERVYKEGKRSEKFISHCQTLADIYLFFLANKAKKDQLAFIPGSDLKDYDHFPNTHPDVYMAVKTDRNTKRYFLHLFDPYTPMFVLRDVVKAYLRYIEAGTWEDKTQSPHPTVLFVCPDQTALKHVQYYTKAKLEKEYNTDLSLFLTTKQIILTNGDASGIWQKV